MPFNSWKVGSTPVKSCGEVPGENDLPNFSPSILPYSLVPKTNDSFATIT